MFMYTGHDCKTKFGSFDDVLMCYLSAYHAFSSTSSRFFSKSAYTANALNTYTRIINFLKLHCFGTIKTKTTLFVI